MPEYSRYETLKIEVGDHVATVTLNRPERLNAVNDQMHRELEELFGEIGIALFCDIIIAAENARLGDTHIKVGLVAGDGGAVIWPLLVGVAKAKELLFTGDLLDAREAERIGLVNRVVPAGKAYAEALALAKRLAAGPTRAIRWTKLATNKRLKDEVNLVLDASLAVETLSMATADHTEAARAFVEKRPPHFTGH